MTIGLVIFLSTLSTECGVFTISKCGRRNVEFSVHWAEFSILEKVTEPWSCFPIYKMGTLTRGIVQACTLSVLKGRLNANGIHFINEFGKLECICQPFYLPINAALRKETMYSSSSKSSCFWESWSSKRARWRGKGSLVRPAKTAQSQIQGHVKHPQCRDYRHLSPTPAGTAASIFETRKKLTRHKLLSRQPHGNHAQVVHGCGPGCGICHGHVELGCIYRYTPQTIGCCEKNKLHLRVHRQGLCFKENHASSDIRFHLAHFQTSHTKSSVIYSNIFLQT